MGEEISDVVASVTKAKEEMLREEFSDTLGKGKSTSAIFVMYNEIVRGSEETRAVVGVPYEISNGNIVIGPYFKNLIDSPPEDYHEMKKSIPINMICIYRRLDLVF